MARYWQANRVFLDLPHRCVEIPVTVAILEVSHAKLVVPVRDILRRRRLRVIGQDVVALDPTIGRRERDVVAVECRTPLVVDGTVSREVGLRRGLTAFESTHPAFDGLDGPPNALLDEVRGEFGFVTKAVVECAFGLGFRGDVVAIVTVPAPLTRGVGAVFKLLDGLLKERVRSSRRVELDYGGTTVPPLSFIYSYLDI